MKSFQTADNAVTMASWPGAARRVFHPYHHPGEVKIPQFRQAGVRGR
jgi:hypothetical protein